LAGGIISPLLLLTGPYEPIRLTGIFWLGGWSAVAIALLVPVLVRGDWVQRMLAAALMLIPMLALVMAFSSAIDDG